MSRFILIKNENPSKCVYGSQSLYECVCACSFDGMPTFHVIRNIVVTFQFFFKSIRTFVCLFTWYRNIINTDRQTLVWWIQMDVVNWRAWIEIASKSKLYLIKINLWTVAATLSSHLYCTPIWWQYFQFMTFHNIPFRIFAHTKKTAQRNTSQHHGFKRFILQMILHSVYSVHLRLSSSSSSLHQAPYMKSKLLYLVEYSSGGSGGYTSYRC